MTIVLRAGGLVGTFNNGAWHADDEGFERLLNMSHQFFSYGVGITQTVYSVDHDISITEKMAERYGWEIVSYDREVDDNEYPPDAVF